MANLEKLSKDLTELRLKNFEKACVLDLARLLPAERDPLIEWIARWVRIELAERKTSAVANRVKNAKFIKVQTIDQFNFDHNGMTKKLRTPYLGLFDSIDGEEFPSAVFIGLAGLGKTHLARALGYRACQMGHSVFIHHRRRNGEPARDGQENGPARF